MELAVGRSKGWAGGGGGGLKLGLNVDARR